MIFKLSAMAVIAASLAALIKGYRPDIAIQVGIAAGLLILLTVIEQVTGIISSLYELADSYGLSKSYFNVIFKLIGIAYAAQFACEVCKDSGDSAIAGRVELAARIIMLALATPMVVELLGKINALLAL